MERNRILCFMHSKTNALTKYIMSVSREVLNREWKPVPHYRCEILCYGSSKGAPIYGLQGLLGKIPK